jgi:DNA-binding MarR family transcriptional regulator
MDGASTAPYGFGDLLALARLSWHREMQARLDGRGFHDFRRGDAAVMRLVDRGRIPVGRIGASLGVTRQAARKVVGRLEREGYVRTERDDDDARVVNVVTTRQGARYAAAITEVAAILNRELAQRVDLARLRSADIVLRASITDPLLAERAERLVTKPS